MPVIGIIGGSGLYEMKGLEVLEERMIKTPFGEPSAPYAIAQSGDYKLAFLPRHGLFHEIQPHRVNYRANLWGFRELGVERIISVCASGGIDRQMEPGSLVVLDQVIDFTQGARAATFYDDDKAIHIDFTEPYCPELRDALITSSARTGINVIESGTYLCVNGPRLESRAEISFFQNAGAHLVGMTGMPEAALARELEICYATVAVVTNHAAGLGRKKLTTSEVIAAMEQAREKIQSLLESAIPEIPTRRSCPCKDALDGADM